jgi:hypothetical protein
LGGACTAPTTTTTSSSSSSTTTTTTTIAPCTEWLWQSIGVNFSDLEYTDCEGLPAAIPAIDVTNNSGVICVYPGVTPTWNPAPTFGFHQVANFNVNCPTTTTTTTVGPCTIWSWEAIGFNISGIRYVDCNGQDVYIDPDDITNNSGDICVYPGNTPEWNPAPVGGTHILGTTGTTCIAPSTTTTTTTTIPCSGYTLETTGPIGSPGTNDWSAINCCTGLGVGGTIPYPGSIDVSCIINSSLILGPNVVVTDSAPCDDIIFEVESTCCGISQLEYVFLPYCTAIGDTVYATNGYCYRALGTSLNSPTITLGDSTIYTDCVDCLAAHPCLTTTTSSSSTSTTTSTTTTAGPTTTTTSSSSTSTSTSTSSSTTTTTTIPPTTTTTTTVIYSAGFSTGTANNALACLETVAVITLYSTSSTFAFGSFVYVDPGLTTIFVGANLWYKNISANNGIRIPNSGQIDNTFSC